MPVDRLERLREAIAGAPDPLPIVARAGAGEVRTDADFFDLVRFGDALAAKLDLRCERPLHPVACTVAPLFGERRFEPRAFARAVAARTGLPVFDIYAGTVVAAA